MSRFYPKKATSVWIHIYHLIFTTLVLMESCLSPWCWSQVCCPGYWQVKTPAGPDWFEILTSSRVNFAAESGSYSEVLGWGLTFDGLTPNDIFSSTPSSEDRVTEPRLITQPTTTQPTNTQPTAMQLSVKQPLITQPPFTRLSTAGVSYSSGSSAPTSHVPTFLDKHWSPTGLRRSIRRPLVGTSSNLMVSSGVFYPKSGSSDNFRSSSHSVTGSLAPVRAANATWTFAKSGRTLAPKTTSHTETRTIRESRLSSVLIVEATKAGVVSTQTQAQGLVPTNSFPTSGLGVESMRPTVFTGAAPTLQRQIPLFAVILCFLVFWIFIH